MYGHYLERCFYHITCDYCTLNLPISDAIEISSGEEEEDSDVVMLKSDEDDDDEEDYDDEEDAAEAEDVNNSGSHINDKCNLKEKDGSVLINLSHPTADPDIYLPKNIADHIKPHQVSH